ncbi:MIZ/SP-RING zinc finger domain-containing protein [Cardiosporidium cionae]|uniref:MIZ/SP-RING zinc finger domain-containing protein n=1 Tax=Cardiosporidium cionae TaxID=476202 RepID=A0ABQ7JEG7_9APIC|nr:MIZ/SP-RING zinc finger domain-containing protein [Cardiosporidium cionae]|eukprot:KAF8822363.1 MIZ/SP-RING zinc finger domain-containing protein [Cardiosporidium cionae]
MKKVGSSFPPILADFRLNRCTLNELIIICKQLHLHYSGRKSLLIERIQECINTQNVDVSTLFLHCRSQVLPVLANEKTKENKGNSITSSSLPTSVDRDLSLGLRLNEIHGQDVWMHAGRICLCGQQPSLQNHPKSNIQDLIFCQDCKNGFHHSCYGWEDSVKEFFCCWCRMKNIDPFFSMEDIFHCCKLDTPWHNFKIDGRASRQWRAQNKEVFVTCHRVNQRHIFHEWPQALAISVNENKEAEIAIPTWEHKRRDFPFRMTTFLKVGFNRVDITWKNYDTSPGVFVLFTCLCNPVSLDHLVKKVMENGPSELELARNRVMKIVNNPPTDEEVECLEVSRRIKLTCPVIFTRMELPCRGRNCTHLQCYDLNGFLQITRNMRAYKMRWKCPVCSFYVRPKDLIIDKYVLYLLRKTDEMVTTIEIQQDGEFRIVSEQELLEEARRAERERQLAEKSKGGEINLKEEPAESAASHAIEILDLESSEGEEEKSVPLIASPLSVEASLPPPLDSPSLSQNSEPFSSSKKRRTLHATEWPESLSILCEEDALDVISLSDSEEEDIEHTVSLADGKKSDDGRNFPTLESDTLLAKDRPLSSSPILKQTPPMLSIPSNRMPSKNKMDDPFILSKSDRKSNHCTPPLTPSLSIDPLSPSAHTSLGHHRLSLSSSLPIETQRIQETSSLFKSPVSHSSLSLSCTSSESSLFQSSSHSLSQSPYSLPLQSLSFHSSLAQSHPSLAHPSSLSQAHPSSLSQIHPSQFASPKSPFPQSFLPDASNMRKTNTEWPLSMPADNSSAADSSMTTLLSTLFSDHSTPLSQGNAILPYRSSRLAREGGPWRYRLQPRAMEGTCCASTLSSVPYLSNSGTPFASPASATDSGELVLPVGIMEPPLYESNNKLSFHSFESSDAEEDGDFFSLLLVEGTCNGERRSHRTPGWRESFNGSCSGHEAGVLRHTRSTEAMQRLPSLPLTRSFIDDRQLSSSSQGYDEESTAGPLNCPAVDSSQLRHFSSPTERRNRFSMPNLSSVPFSSSCDSTHAGTISSIPPSSPFVLSPLLSLAPMGALRHGDSSSAFNVQTPSIEGNAMLKPAGNNGHVSPYDMSPWASARSDDEAQGEVYLGKKHFSS